MPVSTSTAMGTEEAQASAAERLEALFRTHQRAVFGWILRIVRDRGTAEDLTVETFWRIYRSLERYDARRPFEPWARTIATRVALEWLRSEPRVVVADEDAADSAKQDDGVFAGEVRAAVTTALANLPPKLRVAATLVVLEEIPQKEAAAALGISVAAVKVRVFRALRRLRKELREKGMEP